jgi:hypothetical protein
MRCSNLSRWFAAFTLAIALSPNTASAQDADTLSMSGTFSMDELRSYQGTVGADLAAVFANDNEHWWSLTLYGVTYSYDHYYYEWNDEFGSGYGEGFITRVHAVSFDFEFFGPDADVLNDVASGQLVRGGLSNNAFLELQNGDYYDSLDPWGSGPYAAWYLRLSPLDDNSGVSFSVSDWYTYPLFSADQDGYPVVEPTRLAAYDSLIEDLRPGNGGAIVSYDDPVDLGSAGPPDVPPVLMILDAAVFEGDRGKTTLLMTVTLSRGIDDVVTVNFATASGAATANKDYTAMSGTLSFAAGQTSRTISISIKPENKPEPDESFTVRLSGAVGATIEDGIATATIVNDD